MFMFMFMFVFVFVFMYMWPVLILLRGCHPHLVQGLALNCHGGDHGHLFTLERQGECVFLQNLRSTPTLGAIKLGNHTLLPLIAAQLIHAVLIRAQCVQSTIHIHTQRTHRIQDRFRGEAGKGVEDILSAQIWASHTPQTTSWPSLKLRSSITRKGCARCAKLTSCGARVACGLPVLPVLPLLPTSDSCLKRSSTAMALGSSATVKIPLGPGSLPMSRNIWSPWTSNMIRLPAALDLNL